MYKLTTEIYYASAETPVHIVRTTHLQISHITLSRKLQHSTRPLPRSIIKQTLQRRAPKRLLNFRQRTADFRLIRADVKGYELDVGGGGLGFNEAGVVFEALEIAREQDDLVEAFGGEQAGDVYAYAGAGADYDEGAVVGGHSEGGKD